MYESCVRHLARSCELGWDPGQKTLLNDHSICGRVESAGKEKARKIQNHIDFFSLYAYYFLAVQLRV